MAWTFSSASILSAQTQSTGSNYTTFSTQACWALDIANNSGVAIEYRRDGTGNTIAIPTGASRLVLGIYNANQISIRRVDQSNTQVTVTAEALTV